MCISDCLNVFLSVSYFGQSGYFGFGFRYSSEDRSKTKNEALFAIESGQVRQKRQGKQDCSSLPMSEVSGC